MSNNGVKKRIVYLDYLRALAIITVILFHLGKRFDVFVVMDYATMPSFSWIMNDFLLTCCRVGVDLFLMLSGALSLGRVWDIKSFLSKRIPRIVLPFLFWGFVLSIIIALVTIIFPESVAMFAKYSFKLVDFNSINSFLLFLNDAYFAKNKWFGPYWFFWMILGTYLIMPIFNKWIYNSSLREVEYFLVIWLVTCIVNTSVFNLEFPVKLTYFAGPIGMVVLGYYLRHTDREIFSKLWFSILLMIIGGASAMILSYLNSDTSATFVLGRYSICMAIEVMGIFLVFKNIDEMKLSVFTGEDSILRKLSFSIAKYSYGIYLVHQVIMNLIMVIAIPLFNYKPLVIVVGLSTLVISWGLLAVLNRIPYVNRVIGAK